MILQLKNKNKMNLIGILKNKIPFSGIVKTSLFVLAQLILKSLKLPTMKIRILPDSNAMQIRLEKDGKVCKQSYTLSDLISVVDSLSTDDKRYILKHLNFD